MTNISQISAHKKLQRALRYGSHRVKVTVRRHGGSSPVDALQAVKDARADRLVDRGVRAPGACVQS